MTDEEKKEIVSLVISEIESRGIKVEETDEATDASAVQTLLGVDATEAMVRIAVDKVGATAEQVTQIETNRANIENLATAVAENTETLQGKQDVLVSRENIKTINGNSILGKGDITITGSGDDIDLSNYYTKEEIDAEFDDLFVNDINPIAEAVGNKQDTLTEDTQLATINGSAIYFGKEVEIEVGSDVVVDEALNEASTNPVQNKVIAAALKEKQDALGDKPILTINDTPLALGGSITIEGGSGGSVTVDSALSETSENPVQNKVVTAEIAAAIEEGRKQALHALFEGAGAKYNETTGTYTLNEVEGITETEMGLIYNAPHNMFVAGAYTPFTGDEYKTFLFYGTGANTSLMVSLSKLFYGTKIQKIKFVQPGQTWGALYGSGNDLTSMFGLCRNLTHILGTMYVENCTMSKMFLRCYELQEFDMQRISKSLVLSDCSKLTKKTLLGIINYSYATTTITITLHADVYAKCVEITNDDGSVTKGEWYTEVSTALSSKEFVSIVSA